KALDDRTKSLYSFAGIFDEITQKEVSGQELLANLKSQVGAFEEWQESISSLAAKGIDEGLLAELREMGPKAGAEIAALNTLTDTELNQYVSLWQQKNQLARQQATEELEGMKLDTVNKISELRQSTAAQLIEYQNEWASSMAAVRGTVEAEMNQMPSIGQYAVSGLIEGMLSKKQSLIASAKDLASAVASTFQGVLDIHSPSRVFKGFGVNITEGLIEGIQQSRKQLENAVENAYGSLAINAQRMLSSNQPSPSHNQYDQSKHYQSQLTIINQAPNQSPSEIARKALQVQRQLAMEWGVN
ncbi:hypothetical protein V4V35_25795, partial [Bacillus infantis]